MVDAIIKALSDFADWLFGLVKDAFDAIWDLLTDLAVDSFDEILIGMASQIVSIQVPEFLTTYSLNSLFSQLHPVIGYFATGLRIPEALHILGSAFAFRVMRKSLNPFNW